MENKNSPLKILIILFSVFGFLALLLFGYYFAFRFSNSIKIVNESTKYKVEQSNKFIKKLEFFLKLSSWGAFNKNGIVYWSDQKYLTTTISSFEIRFTDLSLGSDLFNLGENGPEVASSTFYVEGRKGILAVYYNWDVLKTLSEEEQAKYLNGKLLHAIFELTHRTRGNYDKAFEKDIKNLENKKTSEFEYFYFANK